MRDVSEARRPSWKLAACRLPWFCRSLLEEKARGAPTGPEAPGLIPVDNKAERSPTAVADKAGAGLEEDFRQLSEEAPSEGLMTIPGKRNEMVRGVFTKLSLTIYGIYGVHNNITILLFP